MRSGAIIERFGGKGAAGERIEVDSVMSVDWVKE
jgi:hypothetical protein